MYALALKKRGSTDVLWRPASEHSQMYRRFDDARWPGQTATLACAKSARFDGTSMSYVAPAVMTSSGIEPPATATAKGSEVELNPRKFSSVAANVYVWPGWR